jgi:hypothetical protein
MNWLELKGGQVQWYRFCDFRRTIGLKASRIDWWTSEFHEKFIKLLYGDTESRSPTKFGTKLGLSPIHSGCGVLSSLHSGFHWIFFFFLNWVFFCMSRTFTFCYIVSYVVFLWIGLGVFASSSYVIPSRVLCAICFLLVSSLHLWN